MYKGGHLKSLLLLSEFNQPRIFFKDFRNPQIPNFVKTLTEGAELFHADRQTDRQDHFNGRFSQFCERALIRGKI